MVINYKVYPLESYMIQREEDLKVLSVGPIDLHWTTYHGIYLIPRYFLHSLKVFEVLSNQEPIGPSLAKEREVELGGKGHK